MLRIVLLLLGLSLPFFSVAMPDIEHFTKESQYKSVKISPDGQFLAIKMPKDGKDVLAVLDANTLSIVNVVAFGGKKEVGQYYWVNNDRLIFQLRVKKGWLAEPLWYGEWFAVNADGKRGHNVFGYRAGEMQTGTRLKKQKSMQAWGEVIDLMPEDDDHILMAATPMSATGERLAEIIKLNVYNGKTRSLGRAPVPNAYFLADNKGEVRFVSGKNLNGEWDVRYRKKRGSDWIKVPSESNDGGKFYPVGFADDTHIYAVSNLHSDVDVLIKMNVETGEVKQLYKDEQVDISNLHFGPKGRELYALEVEPNFPSYIFIRGKHPTAQALKSLMATFPGQQVSLPSQSLDGARAVVKVYSDQQPPSFYLYESQSNKLKSLVHSRGWVDSKQASYVEPISFAARDGQKIHGYITLPPGMELKDAAKLPMIVNPHGGPHGVRDQWRYNYETQLLASRGYAVLQVNFRGSGGFGKRYEQAGHRQWGGVSQFDIIDGTRYAIEQGIADEQRICIYGASYGGYSALQSSILEPDLFQCAVGSMGIYDLEMMFDEGDIQARKTGMKFLKDALGEDKAQLRKFSPVHNVDKLKASLLLMHGEEDERAPVEHVEALMKALDKRHYPYQYLEMDKEGHGLADPATRKAYYEKMVNFLDDNLKL
ncbi:S9 family peptidase [uncultured Ferrimonas sp.]|uniref:alpha/beta hydrolase family protein n=1 Tax=uncultured Ferrimonas sp. TaxID=432640 RepID=UPI002629D05D|nr:S9 family peptidase [uncultured Ferrimonas sp.]